MTPFTLIAVCALDGCLGDPRWFPHPVRGMGWIIEQIDQWVMRGTFSNRKILIVGVFLALALPGVSFVLVKGLINVATETHAQMGVVVEIILGWTTLAMRDLFDHSQAVRKQLDVENLEEARRAVGNMVGRDTVQLSEQEVVRGTVESIAENTVDGVVAPLFYLAVGGVPLAMAFKAISTLDSMVGYRRDHYRDLGWASAKLDNAANWIPARVTAGLITVAGGIMTGSVEVMTDTLRILRRDASKHASPNSGWPEAAMAGVLRVQLGGANVYHGIVEYRPTLGDHRTSLDLEKIRQALFILLITYLLGLVLAGGWVWS